MDSSAPPVTQVDAVLNDLMAIGRHLRRRMATDGFDPGMFWILQTIRTRGPVRVTELAAHAGLDASTVSRHVAHLERAGSLERSPDPEDGRAWRVTLTPSGSSAFDAAHARRRALLAGTLEGWPAADVDHLLTLLDRIVASLNEEPTR